MCIECFVYNHNFQDKISRIISQYYLNLIDLNPVGIF